MKVVVRCRPLNSKEVAEGRQRIVDVDTALSQVDKLIKLDHSERFHLEYMASGWPLPADPVTAQLAAHACMLAKQSSLSTQLRADTGPCTDPLLMPP